MECRANQAKIVFLAADCLATGYSSSTCQICHATTVGNVRNRTRISMDQSVDKSVDKSVCKGSDCVASSAVEAEEPISAKAHAGLHPGHHLYGSPATGKSSPYRLPTCHGKAHTSSCFSHATSFWTSRSDVEDFYLEQTSHVHRQHRRSCWVGSDILDSRGHMADFNDDK